MSVLSLYMQSISEVASYVAALRGRGSDSRIGTFFFLSQFFPFLFPSCSPHHFNAQALF